MKKAEFKVSGMHCRSCEMLISEELDDIQGVTKFEAYHKEGVVKIEAKDNVNIDKVNAKIRELGYEVD